jgi:hypothetical protein
LNTGDSPFQGLRGTVLGTAGTRMRLQCWFWKSPIRSPARCGSTARPCRCRRRSSRCCGRWPPSRRECSRARSCCAASGVQIARYQAALVLDNCSLTKGPATTPEPRSRSAFAARATRLVVSGLEVAHRRGGYRDPESWFRSAPGRQPWSAPSTRLKHLRREGRSRDRQEPRVG